MKCLIIYFSSTGITPMIAKTISEGLNENEKWTIEYFRLKRNETISLEKFDLIGIGGPSYSLRAPRLQTKLLRKIDFKNKPYFVFATFNTLVGITCWSIHKIVRKTAGKCLGYLESSVTVNIKAWKPIKDSNKQLKSISKEVKNQAIEFGKIINNRFEEQLKKKNNTNWKPPGNFALRIWSLFLTWEWQMMLTVGFKRIDKSKCTRCMICVDIICPSLAITIGKGDYPKIKERQCCGCNGCVNLCPEEAIWTYQTKNRQSYDLYKEFILTDSFS